MWEEMDEFLSNLSSADKQVRYEWSERVFEGTEKLAGKLDRIFERIPPTPMPITLYRGIDDVEWNDVMYDIDHFTATAVSPSAAKRFAGYNCCYMKILIP